MTTYSVYIVNKAIQLDEDAARIPEGSLCVKIDEQIVAKKINSTILYQNGEEVVTLTVDQVALSNYFAPLEEAVPIPPALESYAQAYADTQDFKEKSCFQYQPDILSGLPSYRDPLEVVCISRSTRGLVLGLCNPVTNEIEIREMDRREVASALAAFHPIAQDQLKTDPLKRLLNVIDLRVDFRRGAWFQHSDDTHNMYCCIKVRKGQPVLLRFKRRDGGDAETQISLLQLKGGEYNKYEVNSFLNALNEADIPPLPKPLSKIMVTYTPYSKLQIEDRELPVKDRQKVLLRLPRTMSRTEIKEPQHSLRQHLAINENIAQSLCATRNRINDYLAQEGYVFTGNDEYRDALEFLVCYRADPFRYKGMDLLSAMKTEPDLLQKYVPEQTKNAHLINF